MALIICHQLLLVKPRCRYYATQRNEGRRKATSFDIVSEVDSQEARNGVDNAVREVESRFDFRGVEATIELERCQ